jgi:hypothetical protein
MTTRRSFIAGGLVVATGLVSRGAGAQARKPAITVYRDPT